MENQDKQSPATTNAAHPANPKRRGCGIVYLVVIWLLVVALSSLPLYFIPKARGDSFANHLKTLDSDGLTSDICLEADVRQLLGDLTREGGRFGVLFAAAFSPVSRPALGSALESVRIESRYDVLSGDYTFRFVLASDVRLGSIFEAEAGIASPDIRVGIRNNFTSACVESS